MIPGVERRETPAWLANLANLEHLPIRDVLSDSLYYPSSGRDGDPVRYLAGLVHSFVYVDYGLAHDEVLASLHDDRHGFRGYALLDCRDVLERELTPKGWRPVPAESRRDGVPSHYRDYIKKPFGIWSVHQRRPEYGEEHGPDRFSLLYIGADGAAAFQALYHGNRCAPAVLAIIQPGTGFGCNWTDFCDSDQILGRSVLQNAHGKPEYLLYGGRGRDYRESCWPEYSRLIHHWRVVDGEMGLWERLTSQS
jgi:hypothetical protein